MNLEQALDRISELERQLATTQENAMSMLICDCDKHSGTNAPTWEEFQHTIANRCHMCDVEQLNKLTEGTSMSDLNVFAHSLLGRVIGYDYGGVELMPLKVLHIKHETHRYVNDQGETVYFDIPYISENGTRYFPVHGDNIKFY